MKRQLADRARQAEALEKQLQLEQQKLELLRHHGDDLTDVVVTNAKEFQIDRKSRTIQFPSSTDPIRSGPDTATAIESTGGETVRNHTPTTPKSGTTATGTNHNVEGTATSVSSSTTSSNSSATLENRTVIKRDTPSSLQDAVVSENIPLSPSVSKEEIQLQRPTKIPKLNHHKIRNSPLNHDTPPTSSSTVIGGKGDGAGGSSADVVNRSTTTNSSQPLPVQSSSSSSRRLSLEPPSATTNDSSGNTHTPSDDNESSQQSAFYLKHQNRALATELKSYQYSMSELLQERTIRRSHCFRIFQTVQQLIHIWNTIENSIVSTSDIQIRRDTVNNVTSSDTANMDNTSVPFEMDHIIASTGTDDSIEWTRALLKALHDLGRCALPIEPDSSRRAVSQDVTMENTTNESDVVTSSSTPTSTNTDYPKYTEEIVANISSRAKILQDWLRAVIEKQRTMSDNKDNNDTLDAKSNHDESSAAIQHQNEISELLTRCATLESQITELVTCRTDLIQRERRLRRNIYRMASNLISPEQVVNSAMMRPEDSMTDSSNEVDDIETAVHLEKQELLRLQNEHRELLQTINATKSLQSSQTSNHGDSTATDLFNAYTETPHFSHLRSKQIEEYQIKISQLEESVAIANESIQQLNVLLKEKEDEITSLSQRQLSDDDRLKLESIPSTILQLQQSQQQNIELQTRLKTTGQMWSQTLSNEKAAMQSVSDLVQKFNKRWVELTNMANTEQEGSTATARTMVTVDSNTESNVSSLVTNEMTNEHPQICLSKQIHELRHKLQQAMENVHQAELSRENLKMALSMNATLQGKLDEMKGKYAALQNARSSGTSSTAKTVASSKGSATADHESKSSTVEEVLLQEASSDGNVNANSKASQNDLSPTPILRKEKVAPSKSKVTDTASSANRTSTSSSSEKLQREYRKVRKELTAMTTNYTSMMTANVRLLKQITEKDEMNAKSLSTILHLKSTTEKLIEERDHLELQMKNASQLALAARLATNAKDRVSEELLKEKNNLDERRIALEEQLLSTQNELNRISVEWTNASSIIATKDTELLNMKQRCNQLVEGNERYREEIRQLKNAVSQAERDAREKAEELTEVMAKVSKDGDYDVSTNGTVSSSSFTVEQLQTQVSVLKNRLACPVCHYRDKECIIIRCRHMHCKQCVDERVSNRSRKCPTCNVKFAENEVETIFLS